MSSKGQDITLHKELLAIEFRNLPWTPVRVFTVTASKKTQERGNHYAQCNQLVVLISGHATFYLSNDGIESEITLTKMGDRIYLASTTYVRYVLQKIDTTILVLCDQIYTPKWPNE